MVSTTAPRRSKAQNQAVRAAKLAFVLHRANVTAEMILTGEDSRYGETYLIPEQLRAAEKIAGLDTPVSDETLAMCADILSLMDTLDPAVAAPASITCEGNVGYVGAANEDTNSLTPIKTSVFGNYDGRKVTMRVKLSQDGALELAGRLLSVTRKVDAEKRAIAAREDMRR